MCQSELEKQRQEEKCDSAASRVHVLIRRIHTVGVWASVCAWTRAQMWLVVEHNTPEYLTDCEHVCLCQGNVCLKGST